MINTDKKHLCITLTPLSKKVQLDLLQKTLTFFHYLLSPEKKLSLTINDLIQAAYKQKFSHMKKTAMTEPFNLVLRQFKPGNFYYLQNMIKVL